MKATRPGRLSLLLALGLVAFGGAAARAQELACATVNVERLLRESAPALAAQQRLKEEFEPQAKAAEPLAEARFQAEARWREAKQAGAADADQQRLRADFDKALAAEREKREPVHRALAQRRDQELATLIQRVNEVYRRMGEARGFQLLLQEGENEPVFVLKRGARRASCLPALDLTGDILRALDAPESKQP